MNPSITALHAAAAVAVAAALSGCGVSSTSFAPAATTPQGATQLERTGVRDYNAILLDSLGGSVSFAINVDPSGQSTGTSLLYGNTAVHAQAWIRPPHTIDLGTLGGTNSEIIQYNHGRGGNFVGWSETADTDPYDENFCGFGTSNICRGFLWRYGKMHALQTLGGNNDEANDINLKGQIAGDSETATKDSACNAPQVFDFLGVIWQPNGKITSLPPYPGDTVSYAYTLTQSGREAVGNSGTCAAPNEHAVLWRNASSPTNLGSLGGSVNLALDINSRSQVIGNSNLYEDAATHAFLWQNGTMSDLGTLPGDVDSFAGGINDRGQIVGESCNVSGGCRGFFWQNGSMYDLNALVPPSDGLDIPFGSNINDWGEVTAATVNTAGVEQALLLIPRRWSRIAGHGGALPQFTAVKAGGTRGGSPHAFWDLRKRYAALR